MRHATPSLVETLAYNRFRTFIPQIVRKKYKKRYQCLRIDTLLLAVKRSVHMDHVLLPHFVSTHCANVPPIKATNCYLIQRHVT